MASRNGSYASTVDRMTVSKPATAKSASPSKGPPSPSSSKPAFASTDKAKTIARKARKSRSSFRASPERGPQPRGMGEASVNWAAHIKRANAYSAGVEGSKRGNKAPPDLSAKAKKAARVNRAASPSLRNGRSVDR